MNKAHDTQRAMLLTEQVKMHGFNLLFEVGGSALTGILLALVQAEVVARAWVVAWVAVVLLVHGARLVGDQLLRRRWLGRLDGAILLRRLHFHTAAHGLAWGLASWMLFPPGDLQYQAFLSLIVAGMAAACLTITTFDLVAALLFNSLAMLPLVARLMVEGGQMPWTMAVLGLAFLLITSLIAKRAYANFCESVALRHADGVRAEAMRRSEAQLRTVLDAFPGFILCVDADLAYRYVNQRYARLLGHAPQDLIGHRVADVLAPERVETFGQQVARTMAGQPVAYEVHYEATQSKPRTDLEVTHVAGVDPQTGAPLCYAFGSDITERLIAQEELRDARDAAEAANRAKSEFLASMSHELRTPLNGILGFAQLLGLNRGLPADVLASAQEIRSAGEHLLALVNDLIDLARIESGKLVLSIEPVVLDGVFSDCLTLIAPIANKHGIEVLDATGPWRSSMVRADHVRLRQVILNLLSNGIKYNRAQGSVRLECEKTADGQRLRLAVRDTGPGIEMDKQARIFNAFDRLGAERGQIEGSGIGLVITQRLVHAMGGEIGFESKHGVGSTFWVELPLGAMDEAITMNDVLHSTPATLAATLASEATAASARPVVLYIEDNPLNQRLMMHVFTQRPELELKVADTGEVGVALAQSHKPALVLLDINLPDMDGFQVLQRLQSDPGTASLPVIAVTANAMRGDEARALNAGFSAYVTKPFDIELFLATLDKTLGANGT